MRLRYEPQALACEPVAVARFGSGGGVVRRAGSGGGTVRRAGSGGGTVRRAGRGGGEADARAGVGAIGACEERGSG